MGRNQLRLLQFAVRFSGWHTYGKDKSTIDALRSLENMGLIERNEFRQFRLRPSDQRREAEQNPIVGVQICLTQAIELAEKFPETSDSRVLMADLILLRETTEQQAQPAQSA